MMNQQTQVGKTTTAFNLAYALTLMHKRVMLIDLDPTSQLTSLCGIDPTQDGIDKVLLEGASLPQAKATLAEGLLDIVPSGGGLMSYEQREGDGMSRAYQLKQAIAKVASQDFILIDCRATPGLLTVSAMLAADEILIPTKSDYLSLQGMVRIIQLFKRLKLATSRKNIWLALTHAKTDNLMTEQVRSQLLHYFPGRVLNTIIRHDKALVTCQRQNKTVFEYQQDTSGAEDYLSLAQDMIEGRVS